MGRQGWWFLEESWDLEMVSFRLDLKWVLRVARVLRWVPRSEGYLMGREREERRVSLWVL